MPSRDKSVKDFLKSSFSQEIFEKSASTVAVLGNTVAIPLQKSFNTSNQPATIDQAVLNEVVLLQVSIASASVELC